MGAAVSRALGSPGCVFEARHNYLRKVSEMANQLFIANDTVTVSGIIVAGIAQFKEELASSTMLDQRIRSKILSIVDVAYGGTQGLHQAIELSAGDLAHTKLVQEQGVLQRFFDEIAHSEDQQRYCFGPRDVERALAAGAVASVLLHDKLRLYRHVLRTQGGKEHVLYTPNATLSVSDFPKNFEAAGAEVSSDELIQWLIDQVPLHGARIDLVTDRSTLGAQFARGFGGVGAMLRYGYQVEEEEEDDEAEVDELGSSPDSSFDDLV